LALLDALRERLCWQLDQGCSPRDLSPFVLRLLEVTKALDALASDDLSAAPATAMSSGSADAWRSRDRDGWPGLSARSAVTTLIG
jgi:hypothetical protein